MPWALVNGLTLKGNPNCSYIRAQPVVVWTSHSDVASPTSALGKALDALGRYLWPSMAQTPWWDDWLPERCIWSSCSAAAFLTERGFKARVVSVVLDVFAITQEGTLVMPIACVGMPVSGEQSGVHNAVIIEDGERRWLFETSLWQAHRTRYGNLPPMLLVDVLDEPRASGLPEGVVEWYDKEFDAYACVEQKDRTVHLGWKLMPKRRWDFAPDASPRRAATVAELVAMRMAA